MQNQYAELRTLLGGLGASERVADSIVRDLNDA